MAAEDSPHQALKELLQRWSELRGYAAYFVAAKLDLFKFSLRRFGLLAALGVACLIAATGLIVTSVVLLCNGLAGAVGAIFGIPWLGNLIVGALLLGGSAGGIYLAISKLTRLFRQRIIAKYQKKQHQQRRKYGHDVQQRAGRE